MNAKARHTILSAALLIVLVASQLFAGGGSTVRGRLVRQGNYPAAGVEISLMNARLGRSPKSFSGSDGMFYIRNVPPGDYVLELWIAKQPQTFNISVRDAEYTDIAPIIVQ
jgi:hypothetical protein